VIQPAIPALTGKHGNAELNELIRITLAHQALTRGNSMAGHNRSAKMQPAAIPKIISIFMR